MDQVVDRLYLWLGLDPEGIEKGIQTVEGMVVSGLEKIASVAGPQLLDPLNAAASSTAAIVSEAEGVVASEAVAAGEAISGAEQKVAEGAAQISTNVSDAEKKIQDGARKVANTLDNMEKKIAGGLKNIMVNFVGPLAAAFAGGRLFGSYTSEADALGKLADSISVDIGDLDAWSQATALAGGSAEAFKGTIQSLSASLAQMATTGTGRTKAFFDKLGISAKDSTGKVKPIFDVMKELAAKVEGMDKQTSTGLLTRMGFDKGSINLIQTGVKAVDEEIARVKELGVYTKRDAEVAADFNDRVDELGKSFKTFAAIGMRVVTPALAWIAEKLTKIISFMRKNEPFVLAVLGGIAAIITAKLIPAIVKMGAAMLANPMTWVWASIVAAIAAVALVIDDLYGYINGKKSAFAGFWAQFGTAEEVKKKLEGLWETIKGVASAVWDWGKKWGPLILAVYVGVKALGALENTFKSVEKLFDIVAAHPILATFALLALAIKYMSDNWGELEGKMVAGLQKIEGLLKPIMNLLNKFESVRGFLGITAIEDAEKNENELFNFEDRAAAYVAAVEAARKNGTPRPNLEDYRRPAELPTTGGQFNAAPPVNNSSVEISHDGTTNITVNTQATDAEGTGEAVAQAMRPSPYLTGEIANVVERGSS